MFDAGLRLLRFFLFLNSDRSGAIACDELDAAIHNLGLDLTREELDKIIDEVDQRGNHQIDFDEFCVVMRRLYTKKSNWSDVTQQCFQIFDRVRVHRSKFNMNIPE